MCIYIIFIYIYIYYPDNQSPLSDKPTWTIKNALFSHLLKYWLVENRFPYYELTKSPANSGSTTPYFISNQQLSKTFTVHMVPINHKLVYKPINSWIFT